MTDLQLIRQCIGRCAAARDGRGRWRVVDYTALRLRTTGSSPAVALATAEAASRFGVWLRGVAA